MLEEHQESLKKDFKRMNNFNNNIWSWFLTDYSFANVQLFSNNFL